VPKPPDCASTGQSDGGEGARDAEQGPHFELASVWFTAAMRVPDVKTKFAVQGVYAVGICGADFGTFIRKQYDEYGRVISEANIKAQ
jgi:hypothetical protein